jgi:hypothetical protein
MLLLLFSLEMITMKYFVYVILLSAWATHGWASDDETLEDTQYIHTQNQSGSLDLQTFTPEDIICSIVPVADDRTESLDDLSLVTVLSDFDLLYMISQYLDEEGLLALDIISRQTHFNIRTLIADHMTRFERSLDPSHSALQQDALFNRVPSATHFQDILKKAMSAAIHTNPFVQFHKKLPASLTAKHLPELRNIELNDLDRILTCLLPYTIYATSDNKDIAEPHPKLKKDLDALKEGRTYTFFSALTGNPEEVEVDGAPYIIITETEFISEHNRSLLILTPHFIHNPDTYLLLDLENETARNLNSSQLRNITNILLLNTQNNLTQIGQGFLSGCTGLQTVDLSPLYNLTQIGQGFLSECTGLQTVDFSPLYNLTKIGQGFLFGCTGLQTITVANEKQKALFISKIPQNILNQVTWTILDN